MPGTQLIDLPIDMQKLIFKQSLLHWADLKNAELVCKQWKTIIIPAVKNEIKNENPERIYSFFFSRTNNKTSLDQEQAWSFTDGNDITAIYASTQDATKNNSVGFFEVTFPLSKCITFKKSTATPNCFIYKGGFKADEILQHIDKENSITKNIFNPVNKQNSPTLSR